MISVVLYGRNDSYGYNLHKRAVLSFNCIAEVLSDDDEIIFVDYNTPNDCATFPEAVSDLLTAKARARLRILRVRPHHHARFAGKTHLKALEPIARNVAVRRANNPWVLSTNTDIILLPQKSATLTDVVRDLEPGYYGAARFEIPEMIWEGFDRLNPKAVIEEVGRLGKSLHLNEIVNGFDTNLYDAPGDFQLMRRDDLHSIGGFHEAMLVGWHLDSNIAMRLKLHYGKHHSIQDRVYSYHCDHTRQATPMHARGYAENLSAFSKWRDVTQPEVPEQMAGWGLADQEIEEVRVDDRLRARYLSLLQDRIGAPLEAPSEAGLSPLDQGYSPEHVLPFLADLFVAAPRDWRIAWLGEFNKLGEDLDAILGDLDFEHALMRAQPFGGDQTFGAVQENADVFIFNFGHRAGPLPKEQLDPLIDALTQLRHREHTRLQQGREPRLVVGVNVMVTSHETLFEGFINASRTPFATRLRHGYVMTQQTDDGDEAECLDKMTFRVARLDGGKRLYAGPETSRQIAYGPGVAMAPGKYECVVRAKLHGFCRFFPYLGPIIGLKVDREKRALLAPVLPSLAAERELRIPFEVRPEDPFGVVNLRIRKAPFSTIEITSVKVRSLSSS